MRNNQILAVWGSPNCGKTLTSVKLANMLSKEKKDVVLVLCDPFVPAIPVILPYADTADKSLGIVLSAAEITQEKIYENCLTSKTNGFISFLGYKKGENLFSYPKYEKDRAVDMLIQLRHIADYVIIDCCSHISADILSAASLELADAVLRLDSCDLKGISYFASQMGYILERRFNPDRHIRILSNVRPGQPVFEIRECYGGVSYEIPAIAELEEQYAESALFEDLKSKAGKRYEQILRGIAKEVFDE